MVASYRRLLLDSTLLWVFEYVENLLPQCATLAHWISFLLAFSLNGMAGRGFSLLNTGSVNTNRIHDGFIRFML